ncbi:cyclic pyranopterin monophosphate synthase MoaC [Helicobacter mustelae]|uniref:Cyclic pyranopterin monophosphate synthase n=1 Tax=Helicobacter mustelae (strain ATCC 43772 / CCUG 25715 / CIP 103759 / LMG 18044 / NCTC 12198 / R85-136P) TaxID=679897 RepID=D3UHG8_HELM1|nr:cyclic pyranopterin monophosphate synthase MoaC [Helicobacter mustelae]CBG39940.1 molybdenum cofactor biosynthesis protein C [Helicobacter mustelae 12198]SQH71451.1 molybdenum cofactor biosynthesis protein C [Helicobacter mustelae]STP12578.1 molybdenum cofactor biosynthesis protein C [Helicobacter mustelae]
MQLTHINEKNQPKMVDVGQKEESMRIALASGRIHMSKEAYDAILAQRVKKGAVLQTAVVAAIMGAKKTSDIIPMCHPLCLSAVDIEITQDDETHTFVLTACVKTQGKTGVEMEALSAVSIGLLTIYDMVKAIDKSMVISQIRLEEKRGGKSGDFHRL